eukprot:CAMPEP_0206244236 /NCGR_PEP_ID=MMETSP0047_2-20121206/18043_1 /ASSEMBLY_ACC=CAM_ASM_000192 /TAXON_ID=195065 /ORGANISM="Chroomonas mesostigmatica_cf, Strain CCMP1168" /LENGTH=155 /DNA_ID=CAMNT_0053669429 /DNA_START=229 /DNA_END=697 /DNA_ORIENTATION=-
MQNTCAHSTPTRVEPLTHAFSAGCRVPKGLHPTHGPPDQNRGQVSVRELSAAPHVQRFQRGKPRAQCMAQLALIQVVASRKRQICEPLEHALQGAQRVHIHLAAPIEPHNVCGRLRRRHGQALAPRDLRAPGAEVQHHRQGIMQLPKPHARHSLY